MRKQLLFLFFITFSLCGFAQQNDSRIPTGTLITYAAEGGRTVGDGDGNNSPFTTALLEHLGDQDDIAVVLRKVSEKVYKNTNGKQQPVGYTSLAGGALVLSAIKSNYGKVVNAHALIIGNSAYANSFKLRNPTNDARAISEKLKGLSFKVTEALDADRGTLTTVLSQFYKTSANADLTLLFYSGHGVQVSGTNYMLPVDMKANDLGEKDIKVQGVSFDSVVENLPGKTKLIFLDANRDNPFTFKVR